VLVWVVVWVVECVEVAGDLRKAEDLVRRHSAVRAPEVQVLGLLGLGQRLEKKGVLLQPRSDPLLVVGQNVLHVPVYGVVALVRESARLCEHLVEADAAGLRGREADAAGLRGRRCPPNGYPPNHAR
jgi:hypothetical protein